MIISKKCIVCKKKFEAKRTDAMYCGDNCKAKAHYNRGKDKTSNPEPVIFTFDLGEYEAIQKEMAFDRDQMPLALYCFLRRNLKGSPNQDQIISYLNSTWLNLGQAQKMESYKQFEEFFFSGNIEITTNNTLIIN